MSMPNRPTKHIFVTGGVASSIGKGIRSAVPGPKPIRATTRN